jgi:peptidoglycan/LPS O-acetylase OafA/YrhL
MPAVFGDQGQGLIRRVLRNRTVEWLGITSYGLYLWHLMWLHQFLTWTASRDFQGHTLEMLVFVFTMAVVTASISWVIVERPALGLKDVPWSRRGHLRLPLPEAQAPKVAAAAGSGPAG